MPFSTIDSIFHLEYFVIISFRVIVYIVYAVPN